MFVCNGTDFLDPGYRSRTALFLFCLLALFVFRLWFGTVSPFFTDDEKQIYLIGLKFYTTHQWPYFGPEVGWEASAPLPPVQIPGALQGLVVGLPFFVYPIAEAPYVLLNLLSFAALCLLAWYCQRRLPEIPPWIIWTWLMTAPWMLSMSTNMINISYVLPGAVLFFVGLLEIIPQTSLGLIAPFWANFMMGLALFWVMQFHLSWVALVPFILLGFYYQASSQPRHLLRATVAFLCGSALTAIFLLPTYLKFGLGRGTGGTLKVVTFDRFGHPRQLIATALNVLSRLLSLASFEVPRFIGAKTASRVAFLHEHEWMAPFVIFLGIAGILQTIAMVILWFKKRQAHERLASDQMAHAWDRRPFLWPVPFLVSRSPLARFLHIASADHDLQPLRFERLPRPARLANLRRRLPDLRHRFSRGIRTCTIANTIRCT